MIHWFRGSETQGSIFYPFPTPLLQADVLGDRLFERYALRPRVFFAYSVRRFGRAIPPGGVSVRGTSSCLGAFTGRKRIMDGHG